MLDTRKAKIVKTKDIIILTVETKATTSTSTSMDSSVKRSKAKMLSTFSACSLLIVAFCSMSVYRGLRSLTFCTPTTSSIKEVGQQQQSESIATTIGGNPSYELAKSESFGFFDDIDDATWRRHQQRARTEPVYYKPTDPNLQAENIPWWLLFNVDPLFTCPNLRRVGGRGDGPKWTCDPHRLVQQPDCLIYSIGSRGIYRFEDGIVDILKQYDPLASKISDTGEGSATFKWLPHCEIHVFDPAPQYGRKGDDTNNNIHYHAIGLKSSYEPFQFGTFPTTYEFLSFQEIRKRLGHEHRRVDIFKIDCERCEWATYKDWLQPDVDIRQILIETHAMRPGPNEFFDRFLDMGFVPYSKEANTHPGAKPIGQLFEWGFVKLHPNFMRRSTNLMNVTFA